MEVKAHSTSSVRAGYKQTEVGLIPEDWESGSLAEYWSVTDCKHVTAKFVSSGYPLASIQQVQSRFVDLSTANQTTEEFYRLLISGGRKPEPEDLIISRNATVGEMARVAEWHPLFAMGQDVCLLRRKRSDFSSGFMQALFQSGIIATQIRDAMVGSTFKRVNVQQIKSLGVPMPPAAEQEAIAEALSDADAWIESQEQLIQKKRRIKEGTMQELLTPRNDWSPIRLGDSATLKARIGWQGLTTAEYLDDGYAYLVTGTEFNKGKIDWRQCFSVTESRFKQDKNIQIKTNDVLVTKDGTIGKVAFIDCVEKPTTLNSGVFVIRPVKECFHPRFFYFLLMSPVFVKFLGLLSAGSTINHLYQKDFVNFNFYVPRYEEQTAIAEVLSGMDAEIEALEAKLAKARQIKQGTMQELLTGKTRLV